MIGLTYSSDHYEHFQKHGDKNYFEEVIDMMMLDNIEGMTDSFKDTIKNLPLKDKRMTILSLLDQDYNLFKQIKGLNVGSVGKMEHIKDVILMLREYVKVGEVEQKKFGEVMTPLDLVKEMLSTLPEEVWANPNLKWLDPANGTGPFPTMVIYRLMKGLEKWEPNPDKRYKHIIENMIYVCELQPKNMFLYMCTIDPSDSFKLNIYTGSFLDDQFDSHMKNIWGVEKFDYIIGNPPYQDVSDSSNKISDQSKVKLWMKFVDKSLIITNHLLFITPNNWLSTTCYLNEVFKKKLIKCEIDTNYLGKTFFKGVGSTFSYYLLSNTEYDGPTEFKSCGNSVSINFMDMVIFPTKDISSESISIFSKVLSLESKNLNFIRERYNLMSNLDTCISIDRSKNKGFVIPNEDIFQTSSYWYLCKSKSEQEILLNNLNTKFYRFMVKNIRSGMAIVSTINQLPILSLRSMTNEEIYHHFGLSESEIAYIEKILN